MKNFLIAILIIALFLAGTAYWLFQWGQCRKDPDHTFWHCVQVMDS